MNFLGPGQGDAYIGATNPNLATCIDGTSCDGLFYWDRVLTDSISYNAGWDTAGFSATSGRECLKMDDAAANPGALTDADCADKFSSICEFECAAGTFISITAFHVVDHDVS